jgi:DNA replication and repair protein RecF
LNITKLDINGFKNLKNVNITLDPDLNIFCGENAQGKTNIIEAIWLMSGCKSFRGTKEKDMIDLNGEKAEIGLSFKNSMREQRIEVALQKNNLKDKNITLNGVKQKLLSKLFGNLKCVIFTPEDLELAKGSPEKRRSYVDLCISQIKPGYFSVINKYETILMQRNNLLKKINQGICQIDELEVWDEQLARMGSYITILRYNYIKKLNIFAKRLYDKISLNKEIIELSYNSTVFKEIEGRTDYKGEMAEEYLSLMKKNLNDDLKFGFTQVGIHRDDLITKINSLPSREFGSQGQQRSIALILKIAQAYILLEETDESPVILLDDVLSELDINRQKFILSSIKEMQIIITSCNDIDKIFTKRKLGKKFIVSNGQVIENK